MIPDLSLNFAQFLDNVPDIISFGKNTYNVHYKIEYMGEDGNIHDYYPDFLVKKDNHEIYVVETKGREDLDDRRKIDRLIVWCQDVNFQQDAYSYIPLYIMQEDWDKNKEKIKTFQNVVELFKIEKEYAAK